MIKVRNLFDVNLLNTFFILMSELFCLSSDVLIIILQHFHILRIFWLLQCHYCSCFFFLLTKQSRLERLISWFWDWLGFEISVLFKLVKLFWCHVLLLFSQFELLDWSRFGFAFFFFLWLLISRFRYWICLKFVFFLFRINLFEYLLHLVFLFLPSLFLYFQRVGVWFLSLKQFFYLFHFKL